MHIKERVYALLRYLCVKILHKQNFIILPISIKSLIRVIIKISLWDGGWHVPQSSHLHFLKLSSAKILSTSFGKICCSNILLEIVARMKIITLPPFLFLSNLYGLEKPSIKIRDSKKVSVTTRISIYLAVSFNCSNFLLTWGYRYSVYDKVPVPGSWNASEFRHHKDYSRGTKVTKKLPGVEKARKKLFIYNIALASYKGKVNNIRWEVILF